MQRTDLPTVLFVDDAFPAETFAAALAGRANVRVDASSGPWPADSSVRAVVTGIEPVRASDVEQLDALELVLTCSIGTDHLDVPGLAARGLAVGHTPTYCTHEVADHALAGVLALLRGFPGLAADVRSGGWDWNATGMLRRFDHSCLGIVGLGRIGRSLATKGVALGMDVIAVDPAIPADLVPDGVTLVSFAELLERADAISLHAPPTPGDRPLLDAAAFSAMRPRAVLVNTARAALVDLDAMIAALDSGQLAGVMLDVWETEPPRADDPRWQRPDVLLTPHAGWASDAADVAYVEQGLAALRAALDGSTIPNRVA